MIGAAGTPHVSPVWFVWDGTFELRGVEIAGTVSVVGEVPRTSEPNALVAEADGTLDHPNVSSPAQFDDVRPKLTPAQGHGEHTDQILLDLGLTWDRIIELKISAAVL